jgi:hypothetical protein
MPKATRSCGMGMLRFRTYSFIQDDIPKRRFNNLDKPTLATDRVPLDGVSYLEFAVVTRLFPRLADINRFVTPRNPIHLPWSGKKYSADMSSADTSTSNPSGSGLLSDRRMPELSLSALELAVSRIRAWTSSSTVSGSISTSSEAAKNARTELEILS